ncbi:MAG: hypothetical protein ACETWQ_11425 [Phycisphaerae bacterium]
MNVSIFLQMDYENISDWTLGENKPNSNPIKPNLVRRRRIANVYDTKDYRKKDDFAVQKNKPNSKPISSKAKMNVSIFSQMAYENKHNWTLGENKPNQTQFQMQSSLAQTMRYATLERRVVMEHVSRHWQTKWNYQINSLRKVVQKC